MSNFSVAKDIKDTISNHWWLIIDDIWLNEKKSRQLLGEKFDLIILWVVYDDPIYKEYFHLRDIITSYLQLQLPYAKSTILVFETRYHHDHWEKDIPLCFDIYGKLDFLKIARTFTDRQVQHFLDQIAAWNIHFQKYAIRETELKSYLQHSSPTIPTPPIRHTDGVSKKEKQTERRLLDDTFPLPSQIPWLPYIHIENNTLALKYMIWLYTSGKVTKILEHIDQEVSPYNLPWLKDMLDSLISSARIHSYEYLVSSLCTNNDVIKTREWKWRLTMRLKTLLDERNLPGIRYDDWIIRYIPIWTWYNNNWMISYSMWIWYNKDILFNLRPDQWQTELFRRIAERKTYAEFMDILEIAINNISFPWVSVAKNKESLCIERGWIHIYRSISDIHTMPEEQREPTIRKRIDELPDISQQHDNQPQNEVSPYQKVGEVSSAEPTQQLSTLLDECFIFPDDGINELQRRTDELLKLGIGVLREQKEIVDITDWSVISFETLCKDWNEFLKIAILEWFTENRDNIQPIGGEPLISVITKSTEPSIDEDDDLPF